MKRDTKRKAEYMQKMFPEILKDVKHLEHLDN